MANEVTKPGKCRGVPFLSLPLPPPPYPLVVCAASHIALPYSRSWTAHPLLRGGGGGHSKHQLAGVACVACKAVRWRPTSVLKRSRSFRKAVFLSLFSAVCMGFLPFVAKYFFQNAFTCFHTIDVAITCVDACHFTLIPESYTLQPSDFRDRAGVDPCSGASALCILMNPTGARQPPPAVDIFPPLRCPIKSGPGSVAHLGRCGWQRRVSSPSAGCASR